MEEKNLEKSENLKIVEALSENERIALLTSILDYCDNMEQYKERINSIDDVFGKGAANGINIAKSAIRGLIRAGLKR